MDSRSPVAERSGWTPGAVARMLGVSPATLRTWNHRYGIGPDAHERGQHRRYTEADVATLRAMVLLIGDGIAPAAAAARAREHHVPAPAGPSNAPPPSEALGFTRAAGRLDGPLLAALGERLVRQHGVVRTWDSVFRPVLVRIGDRVAATGTQIEVEHVASDVIGQALRVVPRPAERGRLPALLACAPEEQHRLPLDAVGAALAERDCPSRMLGARVPGPALLAAVRRLRPHTVLIWSHAPDTASRVPIDELAVTTTVLVAGPGWPTAPTGARAVTSLTEATDTILAATGRQP